MTFIRSGCLTAQGSALMGLWLGFALFVAGLIFFGTYLLIKKLRHEPQPARNWWYLLAALPSSIVLAVAYGIALDSHYNGILIRGIHGSCVSKNGDPYKYAIGIALVSLAVYLGFHVFFTTLTGLVAKMARVLLPICAIIGLFNIKNHDYDDLIIGLNVAVIADLGIFLIELARDKATRKNTSGNSEVTFQGTSE